MCLAIILACRRFAPAHRRAIGDSFGADSKGSVTRCFTAGLIFFHRTAALAYRQAGLLPLDRGRTFYIIVADRGSLMGESPNCCEADKGKGEVRKKFAHHSFPI
jgi:hypothetical protein